ncbi:MAG: flagellar export protein FliJ [Christensenellales bacterium]|jgi:flagellar export protein FliJ
MKQFVFTLQALYDMQESKEKQAKLQLSAIEAELAVHRKELETLNRSFENTKLEYTAAVSRGMQARKVMNYGLFFEKIWAVILIQQTKIAQLEDEKAKCLQQLIAIRKEKMLLEKLREEQYAQYLEELKKHQAKLMDDFVSYKTTGSASQQSAE